MISGRTRLKRNAVGLLASQLAQVLIFDGLHFGQAADVAVFAGELRAQKCTHVPEILYSREIEPYEALVQISAKSVG